jgi:nucleoside-diphosphate-sugar epimerase
VHVLIVGGTRFVGYGLVWRLLARGDRVTVVNRGTLPDPFGDRIERIHVDRRSPEFGHALSNRSFDAAVDFAAYSGEDVRGAVEALEGRVGHYVFISSGQVYLVTQNPEPPSREDAYDAPLLHRPESEHDLHEWQYGVGKRDGEDVLIGAWESRGFPSTRLRIPMVNGERDASGRLDAYIWRLLDGGPILLPDGGHTIARHIYAGDVVAAIARILGDDTTYGTVYNLAQDETPRLRDLVGMLAGELGTPRRVVDVPSGTLRVAGLQPETVSPFSTSWMSYIDPSLAKARLRFAATPLPTYIGRIVASWLAHPPVAPPRGYDHREQEIALIT